MSAAGRERPGLPYTPVMEKTRPDELDADLVLDWTRQLAQRWLPPHAVYQRNDLPASAVRDVAVATIRAAAEAMAAAPGKLAGECCTAPEHIAEWLCACVNDATERDRESDPKQGIHRFGTQPRIGGPSALRRWNAILRENTQATGTGWVRGRHNGPARFSVSRIGGIWTVVEHGWSDDPESFRNRIIKAAAVATVRHAPEQGGTERPVEDIVRELGQAADAYCAAEDAQPAASGKQGRN